MTFEEAAGRLIGLDELVSSHDMSGMLARIEGESQASRDLRVLIIKRFRDMAVRLIADPLISHLDFQVIMNRLSFEDVRVLTQLQLSESESR